MGENLRVGPRGGQPPSHVLLLTLRGNLQFSALKSILVQPKREAENVCDTEPQTLVSQCCRERVGARSPTSFGENP